MLYLFRILNDSAADDALSLVVIWAGSVREKCDLAVQVVGSSRCCYLYIDGFVAVGRATVRDLEMSGGPCYSSVVTTLSLGISQNVVVGNYATKRLIMIISTDLMCKHPCACRPDNVYLDLWGKP